MDIVVIGGTGHIGSFLVPRLVRGGHAVVTVQRGTRQPYVDDDAWDDVRRVVLDREQAEADGTFAGAVADLGADVVVDLTCFTEASARHLLDALVGRVSHLVHCGTLWTHGPSLQSPVAEDDPDRAPVGEYGTQKLAIERLLLEQSGSGLPATVVHPGHISGPGWPAITPLGNLDPRVWQRLAAGEPLPVPGLGAEVLHHVHADDVAQLFELAVEEPGVAAGHAFHAVAAQATTVRGLASMAAAWWGQQAQLVPVSWQEFRAEVGEQHAQTSWEHLWRSLTGSIELGRALLGYRPAYTVEEAVHASVLSQVRAGTLDVPEPGPVGSYWVSP
ncbi:NAD-dependent epimerase/dehydratase family protein [Auraticoccus sp. F435]|uniref:NAD-dependent epimerase/dehydratase family protein n=1 Tax=Auraticoccus cholistanensis TaxID=2656650 RepID=A0A6A9UTF7_9ACTN|nr:NAD-dependent epimerase/dehydratase family protein [Auraticoccus cholistanensis]MVA74864.1 NAD-dependent epimerase/dehydratase family protein [Auraticoccus cholistanensis]